MGPAVDTTARFLHISACNYNCIVRLKSASEASCQKFGNCGLAPLYLACMSLEAAR